MFSKTTKKRVTSALLALLGVGFSATASALPYAIGDVFASIGGGLVNVYSQSGAFKQQLNTTLGGFTTGGTFDSAGNFYVTSFSSNVVTKFDSNGSLVNTAWTTGLGSNESIVFGANGTAYIGNAGSPNIKHVDANGALLGTIAVQQNTDWIDLAADQKTILYSNEGSTIRQIDTSTNVDTIFTSGNYGALFAKRYLADGGVIAASSTGNVFRWDASGNLVKTYGTGIGSVFALNLDPDGDSFWTGSTGGQAVEKINLATGAIEESWSTGTGQLFGLTVFGEIQAGGGGAGGGGNGVPEPGTLTLLGLGLAAFGAARRRRV